ncbi:MAG: DUF4397 domain-containing protein [Candidatus Aminicenantes bacterium]|nr:DUF4397 domain-containing protein [Candidatus Aminicenantes bacterium]
MKKYLFVLTAALFLFAMLTANTLAQHATVYVVHGIPGADLGLDPDLPVDISVNGACALTGFKFKEVAGPITLEAGMYNIKISLANPDAPCSNDPVIEADVKIRARDNVTIIAHLTEDGGITASKFVNDVSTIKNPKARVTVHHLAQAPIVDAEFFRTSIGPDHVNKAGNFINGDKVTYEVRFGKWLLTLAPWNSGTVVFQKLFNIKINRLYLVYAVGNISSGTFTLIAFAEKTFAR